MIPNELFEALQAAQEAIGPPEDSTLARKMASLLESAIQQLEKQAGKRRPRRPASSFRIEGTPNNEVLSEHRPKSFPFRANKELFDQLVDALASANRPLSVPQLIGRVQEKTGSEPPDFAVRLVLRFLMAADKQLLGRANAKYRPIDLSSFRHRCAFYWDNTRQK